MKKATRLAAAAALLFCCFAHAPSAQGQASVVRHPDAPAQQPASGHRTTSNNGTNTPSKGNRPPAAPPRKSKSAGGGPPKSSPSESVQKN